MAASVKFRPVDGQGHICQYKFCEKKSGPFVAHEGNGMQHPLHLDCARKGVQDREIIPSYCWMHSNCS